ncbi:hypothetical protein IAQ61_011095 [Plenodomus lingam]|uniref:Predicted protein n=1 Tax=Leptosphaeria maculans (strain JN3 / isolate v23.1.3 / race Av1-4-5-6-7-8) TaxID=985895 RepID=E5AC44_LEPMJ|nr:predicted protein [Plenodomus lingam JN3]KAH9859314.1 hypothetical protein IAQ61_011095 [Plenodomus lingam]CBY00155.1 predicted protein [Plenodomus lingam JN3]
MSLARVVQQPTTPKTPQTPTATTVQGIETPNGAWRHPKFDEIAQRQYATTFDQQNVHTIVVSSTLLFLSFYGSAITSQLKLLSYAATPINALISYIPLTSWIPLLIRTIFVANIVANLWPLIRRYKPDDIVDIPLTPSQRAALGLKTNVPLAQTPGSAYASPNYVTPPRYARSTPRSSSFGSQDHSASPFARSNSGSPFSPGQSNMGVSTSSPLFQRAMGSSANKRASYSGGSGGGELGSSLFSGSESSGPGTPTPMMGKASVGLNNKWLYEKRRDSPRSSLFA